MHSPRAVYWDEELGRLVSPDEPDWSEERFSLLVGAGGAVERDTTPAPPLPEGDEDVVLGCS